VTIAMKSQLAQRTYSIEGIGDSIQQISGE
jgi:hypothetical protein